MIRTFSIHQNEDLDEESPWDGILSAIRFAVRSTVHSTLQATPMQLVFGRDAIFNILHKANWRYIQERKQRIINKNNAKENSKRIDYTYRVGQLVLVKVDQSTKYGSDSYLGPFPIVQVDEETGMVLLREGTVTDVYNIRNITPYKS